MVFTCRMYWLLYYNKPVGHKILLHNIGIADAMLLFR